MVGPLEDVSFQQLLPHCSSWLLEIGAVLDVVVRESSEGPSSSSSSSSPPSFEDEEGSSS